MPSSPKVVHGIFVFGSLSAAISSVLISVRLGALQFIKQNYIDGLCVDVWDGFFLSPLNLVAITFLLYLPWHCLRIRAPGSMVCLTGLMAVPSALFFIATFLELMPVLLPLAAVLHALALFGLAELRLARQPGPLRPPLALAHKKPEPASLRRPPRNPLSENSPIPPPPPPSLHLSHLSAKPGPLSPISKRKRRES